MKTYLVSYDLVGNETITDYKKLIEMIKTSTYWAKPLKSVWLIKTTLSAAEIRNKLKTVTDNNDKILVIEITNNWASYNLSKDVTDWMQEGM